MIELPAEAYAEECKCCGAKPDPCPFCGAPAKIYGQPNVSCSNFDCGAAIDFGHFFGEENGIPAEHWVIKAWNARVTAEPLPEPSA